MFTPDELERAKERFMILRQESETARMIRTCRQKQPISKKKFPSIFIHLRRHYPGGKSVKGEAETMPIFYTIL